MSVSKRIRFAVLERDHFACQYCGARPPDTILQVDHIHPRSAGGTDEMDNLITACWVCNLGKHANTGSEPPNEWQCVPITKPMVERIGGLPGFAADNVFETCLGPRPASVQPFVPAGLLFQFGWQRVLTCLSFAMHVREQDQLGVQETWNQFRAMLQKLGRGHDLEAEVDEINTKAGRV
jgi:hypothetical protein